MAGLRSDGGLQRPQEAGSGTPGALGGGERARVGEGLGLH